MFCESRNLPKYVFYVKKIGYIHNKVIIKMELSPSGQPVDKKPILTPDGFIQTSNPSDNTAAEQSSNPSSTAIGYSTNLTAILPVIYEIIRW